MKQFVRQTKLVFIFWVTVFFAACGTTTSPVETTSLNIELEIYNWSDASVEKAAVIINDANGNVLDYEIFDNPGKEKRHLTFDNVPTNGTVTLLSKSTRHLTWPTDDDYSMVSFKTYDVAMIQKTEGKIHIYPSWVYLPWSNPAIDTRALKLQAPCPEGASYLGSSWFNPSFGGHWTGSLECSNGAVDGSFWSPVQQSDGNISAVVWSQVEEWPYDQYGYTQPLQYLRIIDHDPDNIFGVTDAGDYLGDTTTAELNVTNLPPDAVVLYDITGIRKGAPFDGLQAYSIGGSPASTVTLANVVSDLDSVIQHAQVYKRFTEPTSNYIEANYRIYKFSTISNFKANTTWDFSSFPTAPNPSGVSLQQEGRLTLKVSGFGEGNKSVISRVYTATKQPKPTYIRWFAYTNVAPGISTLEYKYPKLPSELAAYAPNLNYEYVSANISGRSYDLLPDEFVTQGTARFVWVRKRDEISSESLNEASFGMTSSPDAIDADLDRVPFGNFYGP